MSEIKTNKLTGTSTAGSILVTGEGNSTTTNLQQGLAKSFVCYTTDSSTAIRSSQSFNISSISDTGTGQTVVTVTNPLASADFPNADSGGDDNAGYSTWCDIDGSTTSARRYNLGTHDFGAMDGKYHAVFSFGDLA